MFEEMRGYLLFFVLGISVISCGLVGPEQQHQYDLKNYRENTKDSFSLLLNCKNGVDGYLKFSGSAIAHPDFIELKTLKKTPKLLVREQLKYIYGFLNNRPYQFKTFLPHQELEIQILSMTEAKYPSNVLTVKGGTRYSKGVIALEVFYKAKIKVTKCKETHQSDEYSLTQLILPRDPYLAFWYLLDDRNIQALNTQDKLMRRKPLCASKYISELKTTSDYWNYWNPSAKGKGFDCAITLKEQNNLELLEVKFSSSKENNGVISFKALQAKQELKFSLISGLLYPKKTSESLAKALPLMKNINTIELIDPNLIKELDLSFTATFTIMHLMKKLANNIFWEVKKKKDHFIFTTKGTLKHSKKKFVFDIYLGPTVSYQEGELHWSFLAKALSQSDFIFYSGHAELGQSFSLANLKKYSQFKTSKISPHYQLIAILSCSSLNYYGDDFITERKRYQKTTDMLLTSFDDHAYEVTPLIIQYLDLDLAGEKYSLSSMFKNRLGDQFRIHLSRHGR
jgi:hypothetical protein